MRPRREPITVTQCRKERRISALPLQAPTPILRKQRRSRRRNLALDLLDRETETRKPGSMFGYPASSWFERLVLCVEGRRHMPLLALVAATAVRCASAAPPP